MINKFKGTCFRCGIAVPGGAGIVVHPTYDQWSAWRNGGEVLGFLRYPALVAHEECEKQFSGTARHYLYAPDCG